MLQQLAHSFIEPLLNHALLHDHLSQSRLDSLADKYLAVEITDLSIQVKIGVLNNQLVLSSNLEQADCFIRTSTKHLKELQDTSKLTQMIKSDAVVLEGDLKVAQQFATLLLENKINWQRLIGNVIGDANAYRLLSSLENLKVFVDKKTTDLDYTASTLLTDELLVAPCHDEVAEFVENVDQLQAKTEKLLAEVQRLKSSGV